MQDGGFSVEMAGGVPVVAAPEEIDITNAPMLRSALLEAAAHGHGTLVADLSRTVFCDSSGLHTLLAAHRRAQAEGGELLLVLGGPGVLRVFALTAIDRMIPNFSSLAEALAQTSADGWAAVSELARGSEDSAAKSAALADSSALADPTGQPADRETLREPGPACAGRASQGRTRR